MVSRNVAIIAAVLVIVFFGFMFVSNMTGNVITGTVVQGGDVESDMVLENELFRIDDFGSGLNDEEEKNDTQNNSESR